MAQRVVLLHALTPLHPGTGQGIGAIDLPIHRERSTGLPILPGSSIRGALRASFRRSGDPQEDRIFGPKRGNDASEFAGALRISDAQLLLLPVRCLAATFVYATSPFLLRRFERFAKSAGLAGVPKVPSLAADHAKVSSADSIIRLNKENRLVLEDYDFQCAQIPDPDSKAWSDFLAPLLFGDSDDSQSEFKKRFAILDDNALFFFSEFATQITAHIAIDEKTGTVAEGALWYQEAVPAESVCVSLMQADNSRDNHLTAAQVIDSIRERSDIQFGGKASTGNGMMRFLPLIARRPGGKA
jgi:CRISPR-associated protein Cmr4